MEECFQKFPNIDQSNENTVKNNKECMHMQHDKVKHKI